MGLGFIGVGVKFGGLRFRVKLRGVGFRVSSPRFEGFWTIHRLLVEEIATSVYQSHTLLNHTPTLLATAPNKVYIN